MTRPGSGRTATLRRATSESTVELELDLDGSGRSRIDTTVPFFDHLLTAFAKHSLGDICRAYVGPAFRLPVTRHVFQRREYFAGT